MVQFDPEKKMVISKKINKIFLLKLTLHVKLTYKMEKKIMSEIIVKNNQMLEGQFHVYEIHIEYIFIYSHINNFSSLNH